LKISEMAKNFEPHFSTVQVTYQLWQKWNRLYFGWFFSQTHLVTLILSKFLGRMYVPTQVEGADWKCFAKRIPSIFVRTGTDVVILNICINAKNLPYFFVPEAPRASTYI
jgi:hypothetical protein